MQENGHRQEIEISNRSCIVCDNKTVEQFLDLGQTALANKFLTNEEIALAEPTYPLRVGFCYRCGHVQLTDIVPPQAMFEDYLYVSSASDTLKAHLYDLSDTVVQRYHLTAHDLVIDIGCNDGSLLSGFRRHGVRVLGVDPAANLAELTRANGIDRLVAFFSRRTAQEIVDRWGPATVITATNTFPHIPQLEEFIAGLQIVLKPGGAFVIEAHYLVDLLEQGAFDTIYHEHVSYWALGPMVHLFDRAGMEVVHVERLPLHHGQIRVFRPEKTRRFRPAHRGFALDSERSLGINEFATYQRFAQKTQEIKTELNEKIRELRRRRKAPRGLRGSGKR